MKHLSFSATLATISIFAVASTAAWALPDVSSESQNAIVKAVKQVGPAVVNIDTTYRAKRTGLRIPDMFKDFFGDNIFGETEPSQGQGSGFVIDGKAGYVVTNEHVIHDADAISITLPNKQTFKGKLIGSDRLSDIAVVKVEGTNLPAAKLSTSGESIIGSWAIAIGNPYGFQNTVTVGVISATGRRLKAPDGREMEDLLQTDAAINPGNSGGPLCDIGGNVIGMNTAIIPSAQGMGFAIPADTIHKVVAELIKNGRVIRPWLGFIYVDFTPQLAQRFQMEHEQGVIVQIYRGYSAERSGLMTGDIIVEAAGKPIKSAHDLDAITKPLKVADKLPLTVSREGKKYKLSVTVDEMPPQ